MNNRKSRIKKAREMWNFLTTQHAFRQAPLLTLLRSATWFWRRMWRKPTVVDLDRWNVRMFFSAEKKGFGKFIYAFRENYEPELAYLEEILSPGMIFVDAGANFGVYTLVASKLVGDTGRVLAFEPTAGSFATLRQNIDLNRSSNVRLFQVALAQKKGRAWLYHGWDPVGNSLGRDPLSRSEGEEVQTESLDTVLKENGIDRVDVIKIDVEGAEELVLQGAIRCLTTQLPIVIFEVNPGCAGRLGLSPWGARDLLKGLGYESLLLEDGARSNRIKSQPTYFNMVAIHAARGFPHFRTCSVSYRQLLERTNLKDGV